MINAGYIILGLLGVYLMRKERILVLLFVLMIGLRTLFISSLENTESRYVLEAFPLVESAAAIGLFWIWNKLRKEPISMVVAE